LGRDAVVPWLQAGRAEALTRDWPARRKSHLFRLFRPVPAPPPAPLSALDGVRRFAMAPGTPSFLPCERASRLDMSPRPPSPTSVARRASKARGGASARHPQRGNLHDVLFTTARAWLLRATAPAEDVPRRPLRQQHRCTSARPRTKSRRGSSPWPAPSLPEIRCRCMACRVGSENGRRTSSRAFPSWLR